MRICTIDLGCTVHVLIAPLVSTVPLRCRREFEGLSQVTNPNMTQLLGIGDDLASALSISLFYQGSDAVGSNQVVGGARVDTVIADFVVGSVIAEDMLLCESGEGMFQLSGGDSSLLLQLGSR